MQQEKIVIVQALRTAIGAIGGGLAPLQAGDLAALVIGDLIRRSGVEAEAVDYTCMGWVMQDPRSPNLARNAALLAGVPADRPATTFHENCASGAAAVHSLARRLLLGEIKLGIAGGVESMSNVPRYLYAGRVKGQMYGDFKLVDGLFGALTDAYVGARGELMGFMTERLADKYELSRQEQDEVAYASHCNARQAWREGAFADYVIPVDVPARKKTVVVERDEGPRDLSRETLAAEKPYFKDEGTITRLNASSLNDGAAALMMTTESHARELGLTPLAELRSFANVGVPRELMGEGAFKVLPPLLERAGMQLGDVDLFELNEAFAAVVAAAFHDLPDLDPRRVNLWGSGISLGHPVGCTGARQVVDMLHQLRRRDQQIGVTTRCVGGGQGSAELLVRM